MILLFLSELWQVSGFLGVLRFLPPIKLTTQDTKQKARTWTIVGAVHGECHTLLTLKTMLCISKEMRIGLVYKVLNATNA
jgi:hypothetical protein